MGQYRVIASPCSSCGMANDAAASVVGEGAPSEGDVTICIGCGEILVFNSIGATEKMSQEMLDSVPEEQRTVLLGIQKSVRK